MPAADPLVYVMSEVLGGVPVTRVFHELDGDWQYLTEAEPRPQDAELVHRSHLHGLDASLDALLELPAGWWAHRHAVGDEWTTAEDDEPAED